MDAAPRFPFTKMQAVGNDFVVVAEDEWPAETDWPNQAIRLCERRFGIGGDGFILVGPSATDDVRMRFFNPDGTPDMCGNGLRCVVRYVEQKGLISKTLGTVETPAGRARFMWDNGGLIATELSPPRFAPAEIPMRAVGDNVLNQPLTVANETFTISAVSTGSTHTVLFVEQLPDDESFFRLSPQIENHPAFPERTSVMWACEEEPDAFRLRIWERGVGETSGCGTGACAAAVCALMTNRAQGPQVRIRSRGGVLQVEWNGGKSDPLTLTGPAEIVFAGAISL